MRKQIVQKWNWSASLLHVDSYISFGWQHIFRQTEYEFVQNNFAPSNLTSAGSKALYAIQVN
jgi:hypothetical protein